MWNPVFIIAFSAEVRMRKHFLVHRIWLFLKKIYAKCAFFLPFQPQKVPVESGAAIEIESVGKTTPEKAMREIPLHNFFSSTVPF